MRSLQSALMWITALAVLALGVVLLSHQMGSDSTRPAAIGADDKSEPWRVERPTIPRPQVLQAQSAGEEDPAASEVASPFQQPTIASPYQAPPLTPLPDRSELTPVLEVPALEAAANAQTSNEVAAVEAHAKETEVPVATTVPTITETQRIVTTEADSFWSISERSYGSGVYYRALFRHNQSQVLRPDQLRAGVRLEVPPLDTLRTLYPSDCP